MVNPDAVEAWPSEPRIAVSDRQVLTDAAGRVALAADTAASAELFYKAFLETKKASDAWIKFYFIAIVLLLVWVTHASAELSLFGMKFEARYLGPISIVYFAVCSVAYTNHELKMRLYKAFFAARLTKQRGAERAEELMRYPLAHMGGEFLPVSFRPAHIMVGLGQALGSLPMAAVLLLSRLVAIGGLGLLLMGAVTRMFTDNEIAFAVQVAATAALIGGLFFTGQMLRTPTKPRTYTAIDFPV